jgi:hypothetical protein
MGILLPDLQEHQEWNDLPDIAFRDAERCFLRFSECGPSERALLLPHVAKLLRELCELVFPLSKAVRLG